MKSGTLKPTVLYSLSLLFITIYVQFRHLINIWLIVVYLCTPLKKTQITFLRKSPSFRRLALLYNPMLSLSVALYSVPSLLFPLCCSHPWMIPNPLILINVQSPVHYPSNPNSSLLLSPPRLASSIAARPMYRSPYVESQPSTFSISCSPATPIIHLPPPLLHLHTLPCRHPSLLANQSLTHTPRLARNLFPSIL